MRCETYVLVMHGTEVSFDVVSYITLICLLTLQLKNLQLQIHSMIFLVKTAMFLKEKIVWNLYYIKMSRYIIFILRTPCEKEYLNMYA